MFGFFKNMGKTPRRNPQLEDAINKLNLNRSNNYKDAAQEDFKNLEAVYKELCGTGKLNDKQKAYYHDIIEDFRVKMDGYTHKDQKPYWT